MSTSASPHSTVQSACQPSGGAVTQSGVLAAYHAATSTFASVFGAAACFSGGWGVLVSAGVARVTIDTSDAPATVAVLLPQATEGFVHVRTGRDADVVALDCGTAGSCLADTSTGGEAVYLGAHGGHGHNAIATASSHRSSVGLIGAAGPYGAPTSYAAPPTHLGVGPLIVTSSVGANVSVATTRLVTGPLDVSICARVRFPSLIYGGLTGPQSIWADLAADGSTAPLTAFIARCHRDDTLWIRSLGISLTADIGDGHNTLNATAIDAPAYIRGGVGADDVVLTQRNGSTTTLLLNDGLNTLLVDADGSVVCYDGGPDSDRINAIRRGGFCRFNLGRGSNLLYADIHQTSLVCGSCAEPLPSAHGTGRTPQPYTQRRSHTHMWMWAVGTTTCGPL